MSESAHPKLRDRAHSSLELIDDLLHLAVAFGLVALALVFSGYIVVEDFGAIFRTFPAQASLPGAVLSAVNDVLFVVIILEILRTVTAHSKEHAFVLRPFIIIGIISAVRHLLIVGARMSVGAGDADPSRFHEHVVEIALNGGLALTLVVAYWLVTRIREPAP